MDIEFYNKLNQALHGDAGKIDRVMRFRYLNEFVKPGQILFAGSSLMEQFPIQEFVADFDLPLTIYNRGVGGFTTSEMLACMQDCVYALRPSYIFINIGTNDLNDPACTPDVLRSRYRTILSGIHAYYEPEELIGKTLIAITNLPPRPMMGIDSCGMLLSAVYHEAGEERLRLLMVDEHIPAGAKLY